MAEGIQVSQEAVSLIVGALVEMRNKDREAELAMFREIIGAVTPLVKTITALTEMELEDVRLRVEERKRKQEYKNASFLRKEERKKELVDGIFGEKKGNVKENNPGKRRS